MSDAKKGKRGPQKAEIGSQFGETRERNSESEAMNEKTEESNEQNEVTLEDPVLLERYRIWPFWGQFWTLKNTISNEVRTFLVVSLR